MNCHVDHREGVEVIACPLCGGPLAIVEIGTDVVLNCRENRCPEREIADALGMNIPRLDGAGVVMPLASNGHTPPEPLATVQDPPELAYEPRILERFTADLAGVGLVGEDLAAQLLYLATTSRLLEKPVSAAIKGPSAGGKSFLVDSVLAFFPESAYYVMTGMSERALAYSEEPLSHRILVIYEAAGMTGDFATYLLRSLLSEGQVRYETVEKTSEGVKARMIERPGPTG